MPDSDNLAMTLAQALLDYTDVSARLEAELMDLRRMRQDYATLKRLLDCKALDGPSGKFLQAELEDRQRHIDDRLRAIAKTLEDTAKDLAQKVTRADS